jgi:hypothetical protein
MSGEGTAPSQHSRKPQKDDMSGKPAGGQTARATATDRGSGTTTGKSPSKKNVPGKNPVHNKRKY